MSEQPLEDLLARRERARLDADRAYNDALTALDRAVRPAPAWPAAPAPYDSTPPSIFSKGARIVPAHAPSADRSLRGRLRAFIWALVGPSLDAQQQFNTAVVEQLNRQGAALEISQQTIARLCGALREQSDALTDFHGLLVRYLQLITPYVDTKDYSFGGPDLRDAVVLAHERTLALKRDVERLRAAASGSLGTTATSEANGRAAKTGAVPAATSDAITYVGFEDRFRGSRDDIRARLVSYVPILTGAADVLDIGCGRGELIELLAAHGISARGIDANVAMAQACRDRGLDVEAADALTYLDALPDASLGGLVAIQVVEHLEPAYLTRLLETAFHKLRPHAPLILETINPACWMAFFETYLRDLTHARPLHPDTLRFLVQASGFSSVDVQYRSPVREADRLARAPEPSTDPALTTVVNQHADALNARLFSFMDYAVIARR